MAPKRARKEPERHTYGDEHLLGSKKVQKSRDKKKKQVNKIYKEKMAKKKVAKRQHKSQVKAGVTKPRQPKRGNNKGQNK